MQVVAASLGASSDAEAHEPAVNPFDVPTVFFIAKSDDHNRVDYGIHLDENCVPTSDDAVFPYWREFENAPPVRTHGLGVFEFIPYGIWEQKTLRKTATGGYHFIRLRQFKQVPVGIVTQKDASGRCSTQARAAINGKDAELSYVFVQLAKGGLTPSVLFVDIHGKDLETGREVIERLRR
jgi:hypothetical protein